MVNASLTVAPQELERFARRWKVTQLALFGSALRDDFNDASDVDVLVTFEPDTHWNLLDLATMQQELEETFNRAVDLVEEAALRNPFRRREILSTKHTLYAA